MNKLLIPIAIIVVGLLIAGAIIFTNNSCKIDGSLSADAATEKVLSFLNDNLLQEGQEAEAVETLDENGVFKVKFSVAGEEVEWMVSKDGKILFPQMIDIEEYLSEIEQRESGTTLGRFSKTNDEVCLEDGKPIVYFFGSESCPHCQWEHPVVQEVAAKFANQISFHDNMDTQNDSDVFMEYSKDGYVPATLIGCKYFRVGSGENDGKEADVANLTALICDLTGGQPGEVCGEVQELINNI